MAAAQRIPAPGPPARHTSAVSCEHCQQVARIDRHARLVADELAGTSSIERDRLSEEERLTLEAEEQLLAILLERIVTERLAHA